MWKPFGIGILAILVAVPFFSPNLRLPPMGYVNYFWTPHPIALAVNPLSMPWAAKLKEGIPRLRDEFRTRRAAALRPRSAYVDKDYPGAVADAKDTEGWSTLYLRVGNMDTCLTKYFLTRYFPETMQVLESLGVRVHTAFFSDLEPSMDRILPHCGQLRGLFRSIAILDGEKREGADSIASMGVYHDHDMCVTRFAQQCPENITQFTDGKVETVHYNVGDVILFNDFVCHWVDNRAVSNRLALVINVDREDLGQVTNWLTAQGSKLFVRRKMSVFIKNSEPVCARLQN